MVAKNEAFVSENADIPFAKSAFARAEVKRLLREKATEITNEGLTEAVRRTISALRNPKDSSSTNSVGITGKIIAWETPPSEKETDLLLKIVLDDPDRDTITTFSINDSERVTVLVVKGLDKDDGRLQIEDKIKDLDKTRILLDLLKGLDTPQTTPQKFQPVSKVVVPFPPPSSPSQPPLFPAEVVK